MVNQLADAVQHAHVVWGEHSTLEDVDVDHLVGVDLADVLDLSQL